MGREEMMKKTSGMENQQEEARKIGPMGVSDHEQALRNRLQIATMQLGNMEIDRAALEMELRRVVEQLNKMGVELTQKNDLVIKLEKELQELKKS